ncbi:MHYT domain-containing protein, NO-binding membrane sensor [Paraburkholderia fungorum]|uniref:MHYT domain-containing protein, NO-binding membrane sensor n=1 Tax=Paraburkholderia fungorum TaxID=134537 RepID=A0A1H1IBY6_9BURK|nr:MHYT domain-containing protein [Paraburkholderia fungorum]SDR35214.1 MHYT domain-containing protein, NO-binding membrane sensor [Paraburkholderia fungorum]
MQSSYNLGLVAFSLIIATLASYTALDLADRISLLAYARSRQIWLAGGALAMGIGIWSMHFIGMLSFSLTIPLGYDFAVTCYSLIIAILVSWFALFIVTRKRLGLGRLLAGGILMGLGIASMHYVGMAAMLMHPAIHYDPVVFALSILIAIAASTAALWGAHSLRGTDHQHVMRKRIGTACIMGVAIAGMHYTGMAAANFAPDAICGATGGIRPEWLAAAVIPSALIILVATLLVFHLDARAKFLANSVTQLNDQVDRIRGSTR